MQLHYQFRRNLITGTGQLSKVTYIKRSRDILWSLYNLILSVPFQVKANFTDSLAFRRTLKNEENTT